VERIVGDQRSGTYTKTKTRQVKTKTKTLNPKRNLERKKM